ncbi:MAG: DUF342 domain-containing protein [Lachnospiraceae bacterium]|nr:DUF342 domain-containing protein [Lachnospiraceae bacterium]
MAEGLRKANRLTGASVQFDTDGLLARFTCKPPEDPTTFYTEDLILSFLNSAGVIYGIDKEAISRLVETNDYGRPTKVAYGVPPVDGVDGFFTYNFRTKIDNKPKILEDGTVDYRTVDLYEPVTEGDVIATYTRSKPSKEGVSVRGKPIKGKPGKELPPLKGTGFSVSKDFLTYTADYTGKIELQQDKVVISKLLEIKGDVTLSTGDVNFDGDVVIAGGVFEGTTVRASGNIVVAGNVESCYINAGGNIELKSGMQGGGKGTVECGGDLWGKFFEKSILRVQGNLHANSVMNCDTYVNKNVIVSGKRGVIVGGNTIAIGNIEASTIGNLSEIKTVVSVGVTDAILQEINLLRFKTIDLTNNLSKVNKILAKVNSMTDVTDATKFDTMKDQITMTVRSLEDELEKVNTELEHHLTEVSSSSAARVTITKYLFKGVHVIINGMRMVVDDTYTNVYVKISEGEIKIINEF